MKRYELIVFDWDGTLMDSTATIVRSVEAAALDLGLEPPTEERARYIIGLGLADALRHALPDLPEERYPALVERYRHHYLSRDQGLELFPGASELVRALAGRGPIGGRQARLAEARGAPDSPTAAAKPVRYEIREAFISGVHEFNRVRASLRLDRQDFNFKDAPLAGGGVAEQDDRDYVTTILTARAEYALSPDTALLVQASGNEREYELVPPRAAFDRNSTGLSYLVGFNTDIGNLVRGELAAVDNLWRALKPDLTAVAVALGQVIEALHFHRQEGVAHILAFEKRHQGDAVGQAGRHVLGGMHADIDAAGEHGVVDFLGEQTLAADLGQAGIAGLAAIATGGNDLDGNVILGHTMRPGQQAPHQPRLGQRQRAAACSDPGERCRRLQSVLVL